MRWAVWRCFLRCLLILLEPGVDRRLPRPERRRDSRRWWLSRRRHRGIERLAHRSSVHAEPLGEAHGSKGLSRSWAFLICSNKLTLDLAIPPRSMKGP